MVWTIAINENGGINFDNGSLRMIGTKDKLDKNEKIQSLRLRFLTQLGENIWAPDEGFDYEGVFSQVPTPEEALPISKENVLEVNAVKTATQDPDVSGLIDYISAQIDDTLREATLDITLHTTEGVELQDQFRLIGGLFA